MPAQVVLKALKAARVSSSEQQVSDLFELLAADPEGRSLETSPLLVLRAKACVLFPTPVCPKCVSIRPVACSVALPFDYTVGGLIAGLQSMIF